MVILQGRHPHAQVFAGEVLCDHFLQLLIGDIARLKIKKFTEKTLEFLLSLQHLNSFATYTKEEITVVVSLTDNS